MSCYVAWSSGFLRIQEPLSLFFNFEQLINEMIISVDCCFIYIVFLFKVFSLFICMCVILHEFILFHVSAGAHRSQRNALHPLELEIQLVISCLVGIGN